MLEQDQFFLAVHFFEEGEEVTGGTAAASGTSRWSIVAPEGVVMFRL